MAEKSTVCSQVRFAGSEEYMKGENFNHICTQSAWNAAKEEARKAMIAVARREAVIAYSDLTTCIKSFPLEPHDPHLARMLGDISMDEDEAGRGTLSAVVVNKRDERPGSGFFTLARSLGRGPADEVKRWSEELQKVYDAWAT